MNKTEAEKTAQALKEYADKLKLEQALKKELASIFNVMRKDFQAAILKGGSISANTYAAAFRNVLDNHHKRVERAFSKQIINYLRKPDNDPVIIKLKIIAKARGVTYQQLIKGLHKTLKRDLAALRVSHVATSVASLTTTNQKELDEALRFAKLSLIDSVGDDYTQVQLAGKASRNFRKRSVARRSGIAAIETQKAAEGSKEVERFNYLKVRNDALVVNEIGRAEPEEVWISIGDDKARIAHLRADFQRKQNGVFIVDGEHLLYPGDSSLGASMKNIAGCRCSAVTTLNED